MSDHERERLSPPSHKGRLQRLKRFKKELQEKKKMTREEAYSFGLITLGVSIRIMDDYIKQLHLLGIIEAEYGQPIIWKKDVKTMIDDI